MRRNRRGAAVAGPFWPPLQGYVSRANAGGAPQARVSIQSTKGLCPWPARPVPFGFGSPARGPPKKVVRNFTSPGPCRPPVQPTVLHGHSTV